MKFSGVETTVKRNFYTQTGNFGFGVNCVVDNTTGRYEFGVSGQNSKVSFVLESGKIYYEGSYIHSYFSDDPFSIEAQFSSGGVNIIKDGYALVYNKPKSTGAYDYFYMNRSNASIGASFDLNISGNNIPNYYISQSANWYETGQKVVTGYIVNQSNYPINVFDMSFSASENYSLGKFAGQINANQSGAFTYTGDFATLDLTQPILTIVNANFGDIFFSFNINDWASLNRYVTLTSPTSFIFNQSNQLPMNVAWLTYTGGLPIGTYNSDIVVRLKYYSGFETFTGVWDMLTGVDLASLVSLKSQGYYSTGMISGSGMFSSNGNFALQINFTGFSGDAAQLIISGSEITNPINQILTFYAQ